MKSIAMDKMPQTLEAEVAGQRLCKIITQCITNIKMTIGLQELQKEHWKKLKDILEINDYLNLHHVCHKYLHPDSLLNIECPSTTFLTLIPDGYSIQELELSKVMQILGKNKAATDICLSCEISQPAATFITFLEELHNVMKEKIEITPDMLKKQIQNLKKLHEDNVTLSEKVTTLQNKITSLENYQKNLLKERQNIASIQSSQIEVISNKFKERIQAKIQESEEQMVSDWKNSEFRQQSLVVEINNQTQILENTQKERLTKEKELRVRRYKVESQLVALLEQYDIDVGERHRQKEELNEKLREEKLELQQLQERFDEQEIEYNSLMQEKEIHDKRIFEEKLYVIQRKIACRKIQRWYRKCLERKAKGKKRGKAKKGKKK